MVKLFRIIAFLEGVSYVLLLLLLLFIATPIKYILENDFYVKMLGMPHGLLFLIYVSLCFMLKAKLKWNLQIFILIVLASIIPFGTFYVDSKYLK